MTTQRPDFSAAGKAFADRWIELEKAKQPSAMETFGWVVIELALVICAGGVFAIAWNWIIPELFPELPKLTLASGLALRVLAMWGTGNMVVGKSFAQETSAEKSAHVWKGISVMCTFMLIMFILKQFI